jgi:Lar family restriction alleviation protein
MTELKPCPFCGGEAGVYQDYHGFYIVQCNKCGIGTLHKYYKTEVVNDWNKRKQTKRSNKNVR